MTPQEALARADLGVLEQAMSTRQAPAEDRMCDDCDGRGYTIGADPLPSGEPGEPYQVPCGSCGTLGYIEVRQPPADTSGLREAAQAVVAAYERTGWPAPEAMDRLRQALAATATERPLDVERLARAFDKVWREDGWEPTGVSREPREEAERIAAEYARLSPATATPEAEDA